MDKNLQEALDKTRVASFALITTSIDKPEEIYRLRMSSNTGGVHGIVRTVEGARQLDGAWWIVNDSGQVLHDRIDSLKSAGLNQEDLELALLFARDKLCEKLAATTATVDDSKVINPLNIFKTKLQTQTKKSHSLRGFRNR